MDAQTDRHDGDDPVAHDIESRNPDSGDIVAGEQVLGEGHVAPDQDFADDDDAGTDQDAGPSRFVNHRPDEPAEGRVGVGETPAEADHV